MMVENVLQDVLGKLRADNLKYLASAGTEFSVHLDWIRGREEKARQA
jgi:hypothetical protein